DDAGPLFRGAFPEFFGDSRDASVVNEDVDGPEMGQGTLGGRLDLICFGEIEPDGMDLAAAAEMGIRLLECGCILIPEGAFRARSEESFGDGKTDSPGAPGDHRDLACQIDLSHWVIWVLAERSGWEEE